jgi:hypothetical protein
MDPVSDHPAKLARAVRLSRGAFTWWADHRAAIPPSRWKPWVQRQEPWPPGIDEDWAEHEAP